MSEYDTQDNLTDTELDVATSKPLGTGEFAGPDIEGVAAGSSRSSINTGSLVIAGVVILAAGALFVMRTISKVSGITSNLEAEQVIDDAINALRLGGGNAGVTPTGVPLQDQHVLEVLDEDYTENQVPLDSVQFNPFVLEGEEVGDPKPTTDPDPDGGNRKYQTEKTERKAKMEAAAEQFVLKSVMMGNPSLASLSGKIVREGDTITMGGDVEFVVEWIELDSVHVVSEDLKYVLKVEKTVRMKRD